MDLKSRKVFACVFIAILLFFTVQNRKLLVESFNAARDAQEGSGFVHFRDEVQSAFQSDAFFMKNDFVDLNGLSSKWMGKRVINDTLVLNNGMLAFGTEDPYPMEELASHLISLRDALQEMDVPFIYVQMPHKPDAAGELLPAGTQSSANWNADVLLGCLNESGVDCLDLREGLSTSVEEIERYFFKTDHHWNYDGARIGFDRIVRQLQDVLGDQTDISMYLDDQNWEKRRFERPFMGSQGVRVGQYVVGLDQLEYYVPAFETDMSCMIHESRKGVHADFEGALIRHEEIDAQEGDYIKNAYTVYLGSDYRLVSHRNEQAPVKKKIMLVKDSFSLPVQSFMSTIYAEIDVVDKRHYRECSLVEYVMRMQPDAVIMAASPTTFGEAFYYDYGYENKEKIHEDMEQHVPLMTQEQIVLDSACNPGYVLHEGFLQDAVYTLGFEHAPSLTDDTEFLTASLVDPQTGRHVYSWVFDLEYGREAGEFVWTFRTPKEQAEGLQLMIYAGQADDAGKKNLTVENVRLWKGAI